MSGRPLPLFFPLPTQTSSLLGLTFTPYPTLSSSSFVVPPPFFVISCGQVCQADRIWKELFGVAHQWMTELQRQFLQVHLCVFAPACAFGCICLLVFVSVCLLAFQLVWMLCLGCFLIHFVFHYCILCCTPFFCSRGGLELGILPSLARRVYVTLACTMLT